MTEQTSAGRTAVSSPTQPSNLLELSGGDTKVTYSTSSFAGPPQLSYADGTRTLSFSGTEISAEPSVLGTLVTVTIDVVPDLHAVTFTLVIPVINVDGGAQSFSTLGIETTNRTSIGGPGLLTGALKTYRAIELTGIARSVVF